ncbi:MAG: ATP-binding cassette domain-containing protein [bacterium]|nr:ATP-binding cassette domain-containing protein [bacterium]
MSKERNWVLEFNNINLKIGNNEILKNVSFKIEKGSNTFIMGPSGSGKTTILKIAAGLIFPTNGNIKILNKDISNIKDLYEVRKKIGFVFQYSALIDYLTVLDNILLPLKIRNKSDFKKNYKTYIEKAKEILEKLDLKGVEKYYPNSLSGGMQKRVAFARAIISNPEIIFYDEPTSGLDPVTGKSIDNIIININKNFNITNIIVSHDVNSALNVSDYIIFIYKGEIIFKGNINDLKNLLYNSSLTIPPILKDFFYSIIKT